MLNTVHIQLKRTQILKSRSKHLGVSRSMPTASLLIAMTSHNMVIMDYCQRLVSLCLETKCVACSHAHE